MLTWDSFHDLCYYCWLLTYNSEDPYIGSIYHRESAVPWSIFCLMVYIGHVVMLTVLGNNTTRITSRWKSYSNFKYIIFDEGEFWEINFQCLKGKSFCVINWLRTGWKYFSKVIVVFVKIFRWTIFEFLGMQVPPFNWRSAVIITYTLSFLCPLI